jgi:hypothetical protein
MSFASLRELSVPVGVVSCLCLFLPMSLEGFPTNAHERINVRAVERSRLDSFLTNTEWA